MNPLTYEPFTAQEVAAALAISGCEEMTGEDIARDMLYGETRFTKTELKTLAEYKGVTAEYITEYDPAFRRYADPVTAAKKAIAFKLLKSGAEVEFAAEVCGLPLAVVRGLG